MVSRSRSSGERGYAPMRASGIVCDCDRRENVGSLARHVPATLPYTRYNLSVPVMTSPVPLPVEVSPAEPGAQVPMPIRTLSFTRGLWRIASAGASAGNRVALLRDGGEAFEAMLSAIAEARDSVALECYLVTADAVGNRFADALVAAAARGVRVRMVADWVGSRGAGRAHWKKLRDADVYVRIFNPPGIRPWLGMLPRDHRKLLVVDDAVGITGGFGLSEAWSGGMRRRRTAPWRDTAVRIEGPAAVVMSQVG